MNQPPVPGLRLCRGLNRGGLINPMFQKNFSFDLVHKFERHRICRNRSEIHFRHDEGGAVDPFGKPGPDDAIPDQGFPAAHAERGQQTAAVFRDGFRAQKETRLMFAFLETHRPRNSSSRL